MSTSDRPVTEPTTGHMAGQMAGQMAEQMAELARGAQDLLLPAELRRKLERGMPLRVKAGFDPTAPDLHLGHTVLINKMRQFQQFGHEVIFLIGDFTGLDRRSDRAQRHAAAAHPRGRAGERAHLRAADLPHPRSRPRPASISTRAGSVR